MTIAGDPEEERISLAPVWDEGDARWSDFYPESLPLEWRLGYVAHFWPRLLVPEAASPSWWDPGRDWSEAPSEVRLFFRLPARPASTAGLGLPVPPGLAERLGGVLLAPGGEPQWPPLPPESVHPHEGIESLSVSDGTAVDGSVYGNFLRRIVVLDPLPGLTLRASRMLLEGLVQRFDDGRRLLIFVPTSPGRMEELGEIARLLGLGTLSNRESGVAG